LAAEQLDELVGAMSQPVVDPGSKPTSRMVNNVTLKTVSTHVSLINELFIVQIF